jgi:hypothetical protein
MAGKARQIIDGALVQTQMLAGRHSARNATKWKTVPSALDYAKTLGGPYLRAFKDELKKLKASRAPTKCPYGGPGERALAMVWNEGYEAGVADTKKRSAAIDPVCFESPTGCCKHKERCDSDTCCEHGGLKEWSKRSHE